MTTSTLTKEEMMAIWSYECDIQGWWGITNTEYAANNTHVAHRLAQAVSVIEKPELGTIQYPTAPAELLVVLYTALQALWNHLSPTYRADLGMELVEEGHAQLLAVLVNKQTEPTPESHIMGETEKALAALWAAMSSQMQADFAAASMAAQEADVAEAEYEADEPATDDLQESYSDLELLEAQLEGIT